MPTDNRTVFLQAGEALLAEQATEVTLRSLTVRAVTKRARRSTGAFYHYWETQADYVRDLLPYLMRWDAMLEQDPALDLVQTVEPASFEAAAAVDIFERTVHAMATTPIGRMMWLQFAMVDDPRVLAVMHDLYRDYGTFFAATYERLFGGVGLRPADGMTWTDLATMLAAALDGLSMRRSVDPERASPAVVAGMLLSVLSGVLVPAHAPAGPSLTERLDELMRTGRAGPSTS